MGGANLCQRAVIHHEVVVTAERRVRHHRHVVLPAPWQKVMLDATFVEAVSDLIGGATMALFYPEQVLHLPDVEVGYTPCANLSRRAQLLECGYDSGEF